MTMINYDDYNEDEPALVEIKLFLPIFLDPEFEILWNKIKHRTTYEVKYSTEELVIAAVKSIKKMDKIEPIKVSYREDLVKVEQKGISTDLMKSNEIKLAYTGGLPDIIGYLQRETELTRGTLVRILIESERLMEFAINPQKFMDSITAILKKELHRLMIDGIEYMKLQTGHSDKD